MQRALHAQPEVHGNDDGTFYKIDIDNKSKQFLTYVIPINHLTPKVQLIAKGFLYICTFRYKLYKNKFEIKGNIDVLLVSETVIDYSFPNENFFMNAFSTLYRLD